VVDAVYSLTEKNMNYTFYYDDTNRNSYLREMRNLYKLDSLTQKAETNMEVALHLLNWTHQQWKHNGSNKPEKSDALSILKEVKNGKNFRCVEYGIVASAALASMGLPTRIIALITRDVERVKYGAGHVAAEVFLPDINKWVFLDAQFNIVPVLDGKPLNTVEFRRAITDQKSKLVLVNSNGQLSDKEKKNYILFVTKYLFFIDIPFDNRNGYDLERKKIDGKTKLMLVPINQTNPRVFQRNFPIENCAYTHNYNDLYASPL
jgi:hypothetical protein